MIKNIFLPERIKQRYLFAQRIIGLEVGKTSIYAAQVYLKGRTITIEKTLEEKLEPGLPTTYNDRASAAIRRLLAYVGSNYEVHAVMNSSMAIFKELTLPFLEYDKLNMVMRLEVEPLLPFSLANGVLDFIITNQDQEKKSSDIMVAAVLNEHMVEFLSVLSAGGIDPAVVSLDMFSLYGLYLMTAAKSSTSTSTALIDIDMYTTRIAYIYGKQLKFIRTFSKGLVNIAKTVSDDLAMTPAEGVEMLMRYGLEQQSTEPNGREAYTKSVARAITGYLNEIDFTLRSFSAQAGEHNTAMVLLGRGAEVRGIAPFIQMVTGRPCELFSIVPLIQHGNLKISNGNTIPRTHLVSLGAALPIPVIEQFTLRRQEFSASDKGQFKKQILTGAVLLGLLVSIFFGTLMWRIQSLKRELASSNEETIKKIRDAVPNIKGGTNRKIIVANAKEALAEQEKSIIYVDPSRPSVLANLFELTSKIEKQVIGLNTDRIVIEGDTITLKARVKDYEALKILVKNLHESPRFVFKNPDSYDFEITINVVNPDDI